MLIATGICGLIQDQLCKQVFRKNCIIFKTVWPDTRELDPLWISASFSIIICVYLLHCVNRHLVISGKYLPESVKLARFHCTWLDIIVFVEISFLFCSGGIPKFSLCGQFYGAYCMWRSSLYNHISSGMNCRTGCGLHSWPTGATPCWGYTLWSSL